MSSAAGAAAAAAVKAKREEEERLTMYREGEVSQEWEFKIVRSSTGAFRNPEKFPQLIAEEAQSGWVFLEKFDEYRVRLKRPRSAAGRDGFTTIDPYRTNFGMSESKLALVIIGCIFGGIGVVIAALLAANVIR